MPFRKKTNPSLSDDDNNDDEDDDYEGVWDNTQCKISQKITNTSTATQISQNNDSNAENTKDGWELIPLQKNRHNLAIKLPGTTRYDT